MDETYQKVILVEDNLAEAKLAHIAFSSHPDRPEIIHCSDGDKFIELLRSISLGQIAYVLLDLNMPRVTGIDVLKTLSTNEEWKRLPVIVFTSSAFPKDISTCYAHGANAYVVKPVEYDELDCKLTAIHNFWGRTNQVPFSSSFSEI